MNPEKDALKTHIFRLYKVFQHEIVGYIRIIYDIIKVLYEPHTIRTHQITFFSFYIFNNKYILLCSPQIGP